MCDKIILLGASGHAKVVADIVIKTGNILVGFLDDNIKVETTIIKHERQEYKVLGKIKDAIKISKENSDIKFVIAIGNNYIRKKIANEYELPYITLIHPKTNIGIDTEIGNGTVIMANATVNTGAQIGLHCIVNTGAIVEHDNQLDDYVHISPNTTLCGTVKIGKLTHIGAGATVKNNINITSNCIIGAGAVVVKDIVEEGTYTGVPALKK